jgi:hypothetical protein
LISTQAGARRISRQRPGEDRADIGQQYLDLVEPEELLFGGNSRTVRPHRQSLDDLFDVFELAAPARFEFGRVELFRGRTSSVCPT